MTKRIFRSVFLTAFALSLIHISIGYASLSAVDESVAAVSVDGVIPTEETVADGSFPIPVSYTHLDTSAATSWLVVLTLAELTQRTMEPRFWPAMPPA